MVDQTITDERWVRQQELNPLRRWREYLHILQERRWIAITTFVVVVVVVTVWSVRQVPVYRASTRLQIDMSADRILNIPDLSTAGTPGYMFGQYIQTQVKALRSRTFAERVAQSIATSTDPEVRAIVAGMQGLAGRILSGLSVRPVEDTLLIDITVEDRDPELAALLANAMAEEFIRQDLGRRMDTAMAAVSWLRDQADDQKAKLTASEMAVQEYRERTGMVSLEDRQDIVVSKLKAINESLTQAETELAKARNRCEEVEQLSSQGVVLEVIPAIGADAGVVVAKNKVAEIEARIALLELRYKAKHPSLIAAQADLAEARSAYQETCKEARVRMDQDYQMAQSNVEGLRAALKAQERQALELSRVLVEYNELKRNAEADQELYESILSRMRETDLVGKLETTNIRLNDRAHVPSAPFKPRRTVTMLRGAGVGGVLGVLLVFVVHLMDDRIRRVEDFELLLGIPVLAMVPSLSGGGAAEYAAVSLADPESAASEAFRGMRASLLLDPAGRKARRIMVVSASASEGKSLVACNLAATFAQNGERTLLIDADLRRPSIHKLMKLDGRRGLAHLLSGKATWDEVICHARHEHLSVLTGAGAPRDPSPLLASARLRPVLDRAGQAYDRVIIDCPPLFGVSDPLLLLPHVDGVVLVARYNRTHRRAIEEATQKLFDGDTPVLGAVINGVEAGSYSYYYYRYGYNHYYGRDPKRIAGEEAC